MDRVLSATYAMQPTQFHHRFVHKSVVSIQREMCYMSKNSILHAILVTIIVDALHALE
jgi:hypothetical protein